MAVFYTGKRPVTKGRNLNDSIHPIKGEGVYSNWDLFNPSQVLDGAPNVNTVLGADRLSMPTLLEMIFSGAHHIAPVKNVGGGERLEYGRFRPLEYKGLTGAKAFPAGYGRTPEFASDYANYSNFIFDGIAAADVMDDPGHAIRYETTYGGASNPWLHQGAAADKALDDDGQVVSADPDDNDYGHKKINQWFGVPSAKALL